MFKLISSKKGVVLWVLLFCILSLLAPDISLSANFFSELDIDEVSLKGHKLHIKGHTDLPPGSNLHIKVSIPNLDENKGKDHDVKVHITPGNFFVMIDLPKEWNGGGINFLTLKAIFDPHEQPKNVKAKVGKNGENLKGPKVKAENGKKIMIAFKNVIF